MAKARAQIVVAANRLRLHAGFSTTPYTMRQVQQAVFVVRQNGAVKPDVLTAAGFRP